MNEFLRADSKLPPEQLAIRAKCFHPSGRFEEFTKEEVEQSIPERFEKIVKRYPDRIAIKEAGQAVTYAELNQRANRLAHTILDRCGERNLPVAILMEHGTSNLVAIVAALKAGKIYIPLDPSYPMERLQYMLFDSQAELIVAHRGTLSLARQMGSGDVAVMNVDEVGAGFGHDDVSVKITPEAFASIFYTSGSTGQPKGVVDNHRNLLHGTLRFTNGLHICAEDRLSFTHSSSSSASLRRIFPALLNGACLFTLDVTRHGIRALVDLVIGESITLFSTGRIREFVRSFSQHRSFPSLRIVSLGGETVYRRDVDLYKKIFPRDCVIGIWMSSTEAGNITQFFIDRDTQLTGEIAPVGYPAEDMEIMLLDDEDNPASPGETGEIAVKSKYLACGYWRRPQMTDERFRVDPAGGEQRTYRTGDLGRIGNDGCLFHLGRRDDQIKVRGHRVEVAEIEAALLNLGYFRKAFVTLRERGSDEKFLVAYVEPGKRPAPTSSTLRRALAATLPDHMIPSRFVMLDTIPLTPTLKVDRNALPEPGNARPEMDTPFSAPRTSLEWDIAKIWGNILSLDQVGVDDNFFDLGGHSLAAFRIISQVIQTFRVDLPPKALFDSPTVAEMATVIETNLPKLATQEELDRILNEVEAISNEEAKRLLTEVSEAKSKARERE